MLCSNVLEDRLHVFFGLRRRCIMDFDDDPLVSCSYAVVVPPVQGKPQAKKATAQAKIANTEDRTRAKKQPKSLDIVSSLVVLVSQGNSEERFGGAHLVI